MLSRQYGQHGFHLLPNMVRDAREGRALFAKIAGVTDRYLDVSLDLAGNAPHQGQVARQPLLARFLRTVDECFHDGGLQIGCAG